MHSFRPYSCRWIVVPTKRVAWKVIKGCRIGEYVQRVMDCGTGQRTLIKHCMPLLRMCLPFDDLLFFSSYMVPFPRQTQYVSD